MQRPAPKLCEGPQTCVTKQALTLRPFAVCRCCEPDSVMDPVLTESRVAFNTWASAACTSAGWYVVQAFQESSLNSLPVVSAS